MKLSLKQSAFGLLLVPFAAALGLLPAQFAHAADPNGKCNTSKVSIVEGVDCAKSDDQKAKLFGGGSIFETVTNVLLFLIGAVSVIMLIIGGFRYVISGGDSTQVTAAKNTILYSVIGIIVALLAYAIVNFVVSSFTAN